MADETLRVVADLSEEDLLARMRNFENHLVERKTVKDEKDWKKTAVAFANSAPIGVPAVLYIGVRNNGEIETPQRDLDEAQKKFNSQMDRVHPRVAYVTKILEHGGLQALAVIIPGSDMRPHFAGLCYVRLGSESRNASEQQFDELVAQRNSKTAFLLRYKGQRVIVMNRNPVHGGLSHNESVSLEDAVIDECNQFYVTLKIPNGTRFAYPLGRIEINFNYEKNRLRLDVPG